MIRQVMSYHKDEDQHSHTMEEKACLYQPDGHCTHMLPADRAAQLYQRYNHMMDNYPHVMDTLGAGTYEEELSKLMNRYAEGTTCGGKGTQTYRIETKHQRAMPETLRTMLHNVLGSKTERFSSPLAVAPCTAGYWSAHRQDQVFGAHYDAYKTRWTGASTACPDFTEE
jgi:hypothetical protein